MGWDFTRGATRRDVIDQITRGWQSSDGTTGRCLRRAAVGNVLWTVFETARPDGTTERFIGCHLLQKSRDGWGHKTMTAAMHPYYYSCPLVFLERTEVECSEWRDGVQAWHAARKARRAATGVPT